MKTIQEQIEIMTHFANGAKVECLAIDKSLKGWYDEENPSFSWGFFDYRIKEQKKTITIEKWVVEVSEDDYKIAEGTISYINSVFPNDKVKLLETYEVEL